jgi:hypothetical protein
VCLSFALIICVVRSVVILNCFDPPEGREQSGAKTERQRSTRERQEQRGRERQRERAEKSR